MRATIRRCSWAARAFAVSTSAASVGFFELSQYHEESVTLEPGDSLIVFSDGVSEALDASGAEFGDERIIACATAHAQAERVPCWRNCSPAYGLSRSAPRSTTT